MRFAAFLLIVISVISCTDKNSIPKDVIAMKPMQQIVWDMLQADELVLQRKLVDSTINLKNASFRIYDTVFAMHKISRESFYSSYKYYQQHPAHYKTLMTGVRIIGEKAKKAQQSPVK